MIDSMVLDLAAPRSAPAPGTAGGARARHRTEATAGSFEEVLRELDRTEPTRSDEQPADRRVEGEHRSARGEGDTPKEAGGADRPEGERPAETDEAASAGAEATPPAAETAAAVSERQAVATGVAGTAHAAGEVRLPATVTLAAEPAPTDPGAAAVRWSLQAGRAGEPMTGSPVQVPEVVSEAPPTAVSQAAMVEPAVAEQAMTAPGARPVEPDATATEGGPQLQGDTRAARTVDEGAVEALLQALAGKTGRQVRGGAAREGKVTSAETSGTASADGPAAAREGDLAGAATSRVAAPVTGDGSAAGTVPLSRLFQEAELTAPGEGAGPSPRAEGAAASPRATRASQRVAPDGMTQAPPADGPTMAEPALTSTASQGAAVSASPVDAPTPTQQAAEANLTRQGAAFASVPMTQVGDVVLKRLQQLRNPGSDELRLELEPRELGSLKIRLEVQGDGVKAQFVVDRPVVQAMLERAMAELRQNLLQQGYRVDELQVALQDDGQARGQAGGQGRQAGPHHGRALRAAEAVAPEMEAPRWASWAGPGRIDVRV